jgi:hypothetical protein
LVARAELNAVSPDDPPSPSSTAAPIAADRTLDDFFRLAAARRPDAIALVDPPNRASFTDGAPRRMTYGEADRIVSAMAGRLRGLIDRDGAVVGLQIANTVESVLAFLAVLRAGLVAMPMPLLWRQAEVRAALQAAGASALIVSGRIGDADHFDIAVRAAAEAFSVRQVCGFGKPPDGAVALDDLCAEAAIGAAAALERSPAAAGSQSPAVITWEMSAQGPIPVARSHAALIAGGLAVLLEGAIPQDAPILSTIAGGSFGSLATALLPWLLAGGTLALHHPFDGTVFAAQCRETSCEVVVVPGPLIPQLAEADLLSPRTSLQRVIALWRAPEQLRRATDWLPLSPTLTDVQAFGEIGLIAARRGIDGMPVPIPLGPITAPRGQAGAQTVIEVERAATGMLALRGPMVAGAVAADRFADTGYPCRVRLDGASIEVAGPPPGLVGFGGCRFPMNDLSALVSRIDPEGILVALPDALAGHRLAGSAPDRNTVRTALLDIGANPLLVAAFADHS